MVCRTILAILFLCSGFAVASGHGPVFGLATPVNSEGEVSFDFAVQGRANGSGSDIILRPMIGYGITPHLTFNFVAPATPSSDDFPPTRLIGGSEFDASLAWRFHHQAKGVGRRFESTLFAGYVQPVATGAGLLGSLTRAPGLNVAVASGVASRSHYLWFGTGYTGFLEHDGDRRPHVFAYSAVYGFRPSVLRKDYPFWDWRGFLEVTGERSNRVISGTLTIPGTEAHQVFIGPSVLGIYKNYAISGGVQFPVYQQVGPAFQSERVRFAVNFSYFLFRHNHEEK